MGDSETCGTGAEIGPEIDVTLSVIEDPAVPLDWPLVGGPEVGRLIRG